MINILLHLLVNSFLHTLISKYITTSMFVTVFYPLSNHLKCRVTQKVIEILNT